MILNSIYLIAIIIKCSTQCQILSSFNSSPIIPSSTHLPNLTHRYSSAGWSACAISASLNCSTNAPLDVASGQPACHNQDCNERDKEGDEDGVEVKAEDWDKDRELKIADWVTKSFANFYYYHDYKLLDPVTTPPPPFPSADWMKLCRQQHPQVLSCKKETENPKSLRPKKRALKMAQAVRPKLRPKPKLRLWLTLRGSLYVYAEAIRWRVWACPSHSLTTTTCAV